MSLGEILKKMSHPIIRAIQNCAVPTHEMGTDEQSLV